MSLLQEEREIILSNEYVDAFDFAEVTEFVTNANKELFISHHFKNRNKMLVQPVSRPTISNSRCTRISSTPMSMFYP